MSDQTVVVTVPEETPVVAKTPFYKNRRVLKNAGIALAGAATAAFVLTRFRKNDDSETETSSDPIDIVVD